MSGSAVMDVQCEHEVVEHTALGGSNVVLSTNVGKV